MHAAWIGVGLRNPISTHVEPSHGERPSADHDEVDDMLNVLDGHVDASQSEGLVHVHVANWRFKGASCEFNGLLYGKAVVGPLLDT